ncbi:MAG: hypothetical protein IPO10_18525 [Flavobacteriales bacterium]|nr:hypothetical protein [Flavobacteriales bacterium]
MADGANALEQTCGHVIWFTNGSGSPTLVGSQRILEFPGAFIHLYGKKETRTGRKMGHITLVGSNAEEVDVAFEYRQGTL